MRTTISVDQHLFDAVSRLVGGRTKTEVVNAAFKELCRLKARDELLALRGELELEERWAELRQGGGQDE